MSGSILSEFTPTGIAGLDEMLGGLGIPRGYIVFVLGSPGSGKTTLSLQFLYNGAMLYNEPGIYVSLDEDIEVIKKNGRRFGMELEELERRGKLVLIDSAPIRIAPGKIQLGELSIGRRDFQLIALINAIKRTAEKIGAKRLVIDPITTLVLQSPTEADRRYAVMDLMQGVAGTGCTTLVVSELRESSFERSYQFEEYLSHGTIVIRKMVKPGGTYMSFHIEKMRGLSHDDQPRPYKITNRGIEVFPSEIVM